MYVNEGVALFRTPQVYVSVVQEETNGCKEVAFATTIRTHHNTMTRMKRTDDGLISVRLEALNRNLFDVHYWTG